jgi:hypothetical protein
MKVVGYWMRGSNPAGLLCELGVSFAKNYTAMPPLFFAPIVMVACGCPDS